MNKEKNISDSQLLADIGMSLTLKHYSALVILQRENVPTVAKFVSGGTWILGRNSAYYQLKIHGYKFDNKKDWWYKNA